MQRTLSEYRQGNRRYRRAFEQRIDGIWGAVMAPIIMSYSNIEERNHDRMSRLKYALTSQALSSLDTACKMVKSIASWAHWRVMRNPSLERPDIHPCLPGTTTEDVELKFEALFGPLPPGEGEFTFLFHLATAGRALPPGTDMLAEEKMIKFFSGVCATTELDQATVTSCRLAGRRIARRLGVLPPVASHISISTSSSYDCTREDGGKLKDVVEGVTAFAHLPLDPSIEGFVDFRGVPLISGPMLLRLRAEPELWALPRWKLLYRDVIPLDDWRVEQMLPSGAIDYAGLDQFLGPLTLLWAVTTASRAGYYVPELSTREFEGLSKDPLAFRPGDLAGLVFRQVNLPKVRVTYVSEPGYRIRVVTIAEAAWAIVQQYLRQLAEPLLHRDARYKSGAHLYYLVKDFAAFNLPPHHIPNQDIWVKSADFQGASDRMNFQMLAAEFTGLLEGFNCPNDHPLMMFRNTVSAPRDLQLAPDVSRKLPGVITHVNKHVRGTLLGDPFSFVLLSLTTLVICEVAGVMTQLPWPKDPGYAPTTEEVKQLFLKPAIQYFGQVLGDDSVTFATRLFCRWFNWTTDRVAMVLSPGKDAESQYAVTYTENWALRQDLAKAFEFLDTIKSRYFSPFRKDVGIEADAVEPAIAKAPILSKTLGYYREDSPLYQLARRGVDYYYSTFPRMQGAESEGFPIGFPTQLGGLSCPYQGWESYRDKHPVWYSYVDWLTRLAPLDVFIPFALRLRSLVRGSKKGLLTPNGRCSEWDSFVGALTLTLEGGLNSSHLYLPEKVMELCVAEGRTIPKRGGTTDWRRFAQTTAQEAGFIRLYEVLSDLERIDQFRLGFLQNDVTTAVIKIRLNDYKRNFSQLMAELDLIVENPLPEILPTVNQLLERFINRFENLYILKDDVLLHALNEGPSLRC